MRYEIYEQHRGGYGLRQIDAEGQVIRAAAKTFATEAAAERHLKRVLDGKAELPAAPDCECFRLQLCDGRTLHFRLIEDAGEHRWAVCHAIRQTNGGWEWGVVYHDSDAHVSEPFDSAQAARRDAVLTLKRGGLDDCIARKHRDARETKNAVAGERMEVVVKPARAASETTTPATK